MDRLRLGGVDALILEPELLWGGADGVLAVKSEDRHLRDIPIIIVSRGGMSSEVYHSSKYAVQGFFGRVPQPNELADCLLLSVSLAERQHASSLI